MGYITRRDFLKQTASGIGGVLLAESLGHSISFAQSPADMSRVVVIRHHQATDGVRAINPANVQTMMDESIKRLTDQPSVADAWGSLLPDFKEKHIVAIKVNGIAPSLPTHRQVVDTIVTGLTAAGVRENNIIIYDRHNLNSCGYMYNVDNVGVRCFGTEVKGWGYDIANPLEIVGQQQWLSNILVRCDHLINVPVMKWHEFGMPTLSLKNHFGSISKPGRLHGNVNLAVPIVNSQEVVRDKTRLVVTDALFGCWIQNHLPPNFAPNSLIVSRDPVAADHIGGEILKEERIKNNQWVPDRMFHIEKAAEMGLGTCDPEKIELLEIEIGGPEERVEEMPEEEGKEIPEEDAGKAVEPANSYKTQWGNLKS
jgi:uncharacterized protein (DUF362 family)